MITTGASIANIWASRTANHAPVVELRQSRKPRLRAIVLGRILIRTIAAYPSDAPACLPLSGRLGHARLSLGTKDRELRRLRASGHCLPPCHGGNPRVGGLGTSAPHAGAVCIAEANPKGLVRNFRYSARLSRCVAGMHSAPSENRGAGERIVPRPCTFRHGDDPAGPNECSDVCA
jgi:hypothetical protein